MHAESVCRARGIAGRLIPVPVSISAACGLAWAMPVEHGKDFENAGLEYSARYERML